MGFASYLIVFFILMTSSAFAHGDTPWDPRSLEEIWDDIFGADPDDKKT